MHRRLTIGLLALLLILIPLVGCIDNNDTPPDTPRYGQGEAIAVVKSVLMPFAKADILRKVPKLSTPEIADYLSEVTAELASYMADGKWTSEYIGEGRWLVRCVFAYGSTVPGLSWVDGTHAEEKWYVYESGGVVQQL